MNYLLIKEEKDPECKECGESGLFKCFIGEDLICWNADIVAQENLPKSTPAYSCNHCGAKFKRGVK